MGAVETFTPAVSPSIRTSTKRTSVRVVKTQFGDGYEQRSADGLNTIRLSITLQFDALTGDEARDIDDFLRARGGTEPFFYTLPDEDDPRQWVCDQDWERGYSEGGDLYSMTVPLREVFDL